MKQIKKERSLKKTQLLELINKKIKNRKIKIRMIKSKNNQNLWE